MLQTRILSKVLTASGVVTTAGNGGDLYGLVVTAEADAAKATILDGGSGGTIKLIVGSVTAHDTKAVILPTPIRCGTDIYCTITGTTPDVTVLYVEDTT
jgi:hypothetical protein